LILFSDGGEESVQDIRSIKDEVEEKGIQVIIV